jgi:protein-disulfide isomerase/uncharacterized membrane protein
MPQQRRFTRLMYGGAGLSLVGVLLAVTLSYVHAQLDKHAGAYTSFCNVNDSINCDRVLGSPFAVFAGIPVAWWALLTYALLAAAFFTAARSEGARRHTAMKFAALGSVGSAAFSIYMAAVSLLVLETVCLMCSGLYAVTACLVGVVAVATSAYKEAGGRRDLLPGGLVGSFLASLGAVAVLAALTWPSSDELSLSASASLETIRSGDEEFFAWYMDLPVVDSALASGGIGGDKPVTIIEFSDFECGYCKKNHEMLAELKSRLGGLVDVVYRHFPLDAACNEVVETSLHRHACRAAQAAECAAAQGRFDDMCDALFENQSRLFDEMLTKLAARLELDMDAFAACMASDDSLDKVVADVRAGKRLKLSSTPTLFINGRMVKGTFENASGYDRAVLIETRLAEGHTLD